MRIGRADIGQGAADAGCRRGFEADRAFDEPAFTVDVEGFEGPLDLLLELARRQKVDLARISILELAEQYLAFVEAARKRRLELAADYLVMAAWLAYLKSRLLLPSRAEGGRRRRGRSRRKTRRAAAPARSHPPRRRSPDEAAAARPRRVRARRAGIDRLRRPARPIRRRSTTSSRPMRASAQKRARTFVRMKPRQVWSLAEAREALGRLIGRAADWVSLDELAHRILRRAENAPQRPRLLVLSLAGAGARGPDRTAARTAISRRSTCAKIEKDETGLKLALVES